MTNNVKGALIQFFGFLASVVLWFGLFLGLRIVAEMSTMPAFMCASLCATIVWIATHFYGMNLRSAVSEVTFRDAQKR